MKTVKVITLTDEQVDEWFQTGGVTITDKLYNNQGVVIKMADGAKEHGLFKDGRVHAFAWPQGEGVGPKNSEQHLAMLQLLNDDIKLKIITGKEGTGKNYITAACALDMLLKKRYKKLILTRTTDEVGSTLGLFPGTSEEKFATHVASFKYTLKAIMGEDSAYVDLMMEKGQIEYMPVQLMRGVSFPPGTLLWADEIAGLSPFELRMLGTRLGDDCALILTGSFEQIDRANTQQEDTGLYKLVHSRKIRNSNLSSHIELIKNERSALSNLISEAL